MIPKSRLDALTDGLFGVAMTLLVIDLRLPESFHPQDGAELLHRLAELGNQALVYIISFYVLSMRWVGLVRTVPRGEEVSAEYTLWALVHLLVVTLVPFATMVVGRYPTLAPAVWLYAGNMILLGLVALRMVSLAAHKRPLELEARVGLITLIAAAALTIVLSFIVPRWALLGYLFNVFDRPVRLLLQRRGARS